MSGVEGGEETLSEFRSYRHYPATEHMKITQAGWVENCGDLCCWSDKCASIHCDGCFKSLTRVKNPSVVRNVCMGCPKPEVTKVDWSDENREEIYGAYTTLCSSCLEGDKFKHPHKLFCQVDGRGVHSVVNRTNGVSETVREVDESCFEVADMSTVKLQGEMASCGVCGDEFEVDNPPVYALGCKQGHGSFIYTIPEGECISGSFFHASCSVQAAKYDPRIGGVFCANLDDPVPCLCRVCHYESQLAEWRKEFDLGFSLLSSEYTLLSSSSSTPLNISQVEKLFDTLSRKIQLPGLLAFPKEADSFTLVSCREILTQFLVQLHVQPRIRQQITKAKEESEK